MEKYRKSDLICEEGVLESGKMPRGDGWEETTWGHVRVTRWKTKSEKGLPQHSATFFSKSLWQLDEREFTELRDCLTRELRQMLRTIEERKQKASPFSVMVVGLGNRELTPDAVGPETVKGIVVRAPTDEKGADGKAGTTSVSAFSPDVVGNTGIETVELIRGAVRATHPHVILAVDALAARSAERLASVIQLFDGGIAPGSGLGKRRTAICEETLGVPVIAVGIPTVVRASALIGEALESCGIGTEDASVRSLLERSGSFFVAPKETDLVLKSASLLLSDAINRACGEWSMA